VVCVGLSERDLKNFWGEVPPPGTLLAPPLLVSHIQFLSRKDMMRQPEIEEKIKINLILIIRLNDYSRCAKNNGSL